MSRAILTAVTLPIIGLCLALPSAAQAPTSTAITFQGQLKQLGEPVTGTADFLVGIYDVETGGTPQDTLSLTNIPIQDGLFMLDLPFDSSTYNGDGLWLAIQVAVPPGSSFVTLTPRQPLRPAPYALYALSAGGGSGGSQWVDHADGVYYDAGNVGIGSIPSSSETLRITAGGGEYALFAYSPGTAGAQTITAETDVIGGRAVHGQSNAPSGSGAGISGYAESPSGFAIYGDNQGSTGNAIGVYGNTGSPDGFGGYFQGKGYFSGRVGIGTTTPGYPLHVTSTSRYSIYGTTSDSTGRGVQGVATHPTGSVTGVLGSTSGTAGRGVFGTANASTGSTVGVLGEAHSLDGYGVWGHNDATTGVNRAVGVYGSTAAPRGIGVKGYAPGPDGGYAVWGLADGTYGRGVLGSANAASGNAIGVEGNSSSPTGIGVYAYNDAESGDAIAIRGDTASLDGFGGYFTGKGYFSGDVGIGTTTPTSPLTVSGLIESTTGGIKFPDGTIQATAGGGGGGYWQPNGADIYYDGGNVGINYDSPEYALHVFALADAAIAGENPAESTRGELGSTYGGAFGESTTGDGVFGQATDESAVNSGVRGATPSPNGYGVYGRAEAYSGTSTGVFGWARSPNGRGVYGLVEGDYGRGVLGEVTGTNGFGVIGRATTGTGVYGESVGGDGVYGFTVEPTKAGVTGINEADTGDAIGVSGLSYGGAGRGVYGWCDGTFGRGVLGEVTGTAGYGVFGQAAGGTGVYGESDNGDGVSGYAHDPVKAGVKGENEAGTGNSIGVWGITGSSAGYGVYGSGAGNYARGVFGDVTGLYGYGVFGQAAGGTGVYGESDSGDGVSGYAHDPVKAGIKGENEAGTGNSIGVRGITGSSGGYGVYGSGDGNSARGVFGEVTGSSGYGVFGMAAGGTGVYGESTSGNGVSGYAHDPAKAGIKGENEASTGNAIGVWGITGSSQGYGGYFEGRGYFSGMVGIGTASPDEMLHVDGRVKIENSIVGDALLINTPGDGIYVDAGGEAFDCYGVTVGVHGYSNTGIGMYAEGDGTTTAHPALLVENTDTAGIAIFSSTASSDANIVVANRGSGDLIKGFSGPTGNDLVFKVTNDGTTHTNVLQINGGSDLAEKFDVAEQAVPGTVVAIDPENPGKLCVARGAYNRCVAGVISGANGVETGMVLADLPGAENSQPVALSGRAWVKCDASQRAIEPGDLLTTAERPGHAMAVTDHDRAPGAVIGKAMTRLAAGETGMVLVLVNLQ